MRTFAKSRIRYSKSQRLGIFAFMVVMVGFGIFPTLFNKPSESVEISEIPPEVLTILSAHSESKKGEILPKENLENFDPNELSAEEWREYGFSEKQVNTILKYKYSLGGFFSTKEEIRNCYVISEKKFLELEPYIQIGEKTSSYKKYDGESSSKYNSDKPRIKYSKFNPNAYSQQDWERIGFSEKQAITLLKYKRSLGGKFKSLEEIRSAYVITEEKFQEMKPYIVLGVAKSEYNQKAEVVKEEKPVSVKREKFNPNRLSKEEWMNLGFSDKQASVILNYKNSLGGSFSDAETLSKCYVINEEKFNEFAPYLIFED
ncbi:MAG: hypothetical protein WCY77_02250 [Weeksellaceae bacterium]